MLRDKNLIPLSHQHQHALALCVRIERAPDASLPAFRSEIVQMWESEIRWHFNAEEQVLFPAARLHPELVLLIDELLRDHVLIRDFVQQEREGALERFSTREFAAALSAHVRKEERQLFEECQRLFDPEHLARLGAKLQQELANAPGQSCAMRPPFG